MAHSVLTPLVLLVGALSGIKQVLSLKVFSVSRFLLDSLVRTLGYYSRVAGSKGCGYSEFNCGIIFNDHLGTSSSAREKDTEVDLDLESGLPLIGDDSKKVSPPSSSKQGKPLFAKVSGGIVGGSVKGEHVPSLYSNRSKLGDLSVDVTRVTNKQMMGADSVNCAEQTLAREKRKKVPNKKHPKPPRSPQGPALDAADHKLIKEITELAMLKHARTERMKALKKTKTAKPATSCSSSILAMVFTAVFFIVIIFQGMSSGPSTAASFQGSPISVGGSEGGLISVQYRLAPSATDLNAPDSESHNFVQEVAGSDLPEKLGRDSG
ncbi:hypothetical protein RJT34_13291 [Clitoria ternatea]|uniref:Transmembrane protein n=1 Tax=Clitoria ternatea TaxID=43366 RepID=A0AAN9PLK5_CLITE